MAPGANTLNDRIVAGIDVGGTFTDLIIIDEKAGKVVLAKTPSTPGDQSKGVLNALAQAGYPIAKIDMIVHGTTVTTNALLQRRIAKVGMITTRGFRDVIELGRRTRPTPYGLFGTFVPLIPRDLRLEVDERMEASGKIRVQLDEEQLRDAIVTLIDAGCESLVIHFLHSYKNPVHEQRAVEIANSLWPNVYVTSGHALLSEAREFERGVTASVNAAVQPVLERYLQGLRTALQDSGYDRDLLVMNGNGGTISSRLVTREAAKTVMSGPASGVIAAAYTAKRAGYDRLITYDMGGTSTDVALIRDNKPLVSNEIDIEYAMPIHVPMVDVHTVGAGGGSIAAVNDAGLLQVGPQSAGSWPGPMCYGRGGTRPTISDANLLLGRLSVKKLLAVDQPVSVERIASAFAAEVGGKLELDAIEAAEAVVEIANLKMAGAIRMVSVDRGNDPRDFVLFAFGGAGPLHASAIARELSIPKVFVPARPGLTNAIGCVVADLRHDYVTTVNRLVVETDPALIDELVESRTAMGLQAIGREAVKPVQIVVEHSADMQFSGQTHLIRVKLPEGAADMQTMQLLFEEAYYDRFRVRLPEVRARIVSINTSVIGIRREVSLENLIPMAGRAATVEEALVETRPVRFGGAWRQTPVYGREKLPIDARIEGPAILEQLDATTVINPGDVAEGDAQGNIIITVGQRA
ncbi:MULTISPECIES: hydantoinase/oxoprolinase family protein [Rhizobium]|uniref:Hydantoinase/oxoprolinase family protein n=1 Tax=Rhizobium rhododendri TaxID=2506430 RepID=A0ABY8IQF5_9HYPH|nr:MULTISPECIES: hydantoinase/oxoprolinase family protein [Rhizobium]MBZ5762498.1 hydantoinase/oxoprolinase family protein [Rhizobium sp. VS19-DR96]MBZ5768487.1 hydantoinase/oxoprolinase family protein [Rhizobium sp. VS19-DR129.2]MBZ5776005.1 hydantoinase/oxoprolinase family protein [Rhizobium sp. VS19-DRK62.2]MBZ5787223.1 hydantoinase/oxoprolinase family protein [Rhizobium sp. VS19-DR121]MBZ5804576.1 hydantoinase/oxoprolinase family protein [Rhizobium sp. VS19-DR181]